ncbi:hypothetical protein DPEC_G00267320 [Dallia pectoralis]|uniref:Uncharacterized protein n=1 Tax=Dallia pectoralis TaxID=75939 RepID=A0ACC2FNR8_DALPE|nr:hypothetical protein DPEC_G00267320 [Dallia pectoralis]
MLIGTRSQGAAIIRRRTSDERRRGDARPGWSATQDAERERGARAFLLRMISSPPITATIASKRTGLYPAGVLSKTVVFERAACGTPSTKWSNYGNELRNMSAPYG